MKWAEGRVLFIYNILLGPSIVTYNYSVLCDNEFPVSGSYIDDYGIVRVAWISITMMHQKKINGMRHVGKY